MLAVCSASAALRTMEPPEPPDLSCNSAAVVQGSRLGCAAAGVLTVLPFAIVTVLHEMHRCTAHWLLLTAGGILGSICAVRAMGPCCERTGKGGASFRCKLGSSRAHGFARGACLVNLCTVVMIVPFYLIPYAGESEECERCSQADNDCSDAGDPCARAARSRLGVAGIFAVCAVVLICNGAQLIAFDNAVAPAPPGCDSPAAGPPPPEQSAQPVP
eukprot:TRINITY_DN31066_c0_g1_i1.p2 TRINITY_DN31066_c0_g1~~TRINITY_DN31066_c0_g1_i1.p2  ORF type:complete len:216 (+),score=35.22 TRINITY_DN31066_c0_g1_i1:35-682(+)